MAVFVNVRSCGSDILPLMRNLLEEDRRFAKPSWKDLDFGFRCPLRHYLFRPSHREQSEGLAPWYSTSAFQSADSIRHRSEKDAGQYLVVLDNYDSREHEGLTSRVV